ncbi:LCP family protein [Pseudonocardia sp. KRD291]|uniref:LCP family protein n=1 Tax=Pseudonocardia sp. KRD291 TaxID=2792007 RepID=UPI001C4A3910|nr:LCP family protein [Pseudonocardia sp. KRD291]MBW0101692.1 LCP family protein [Pseudonocardia sp. KRD291]
MTDIRDPWLRSTDRWTDRSPAPPRAAPTAPSRSASTGPAAARAAARREARGRTPVPPRTGTGRGWDRWSQRLRVAVAVLSAVVVAVTGAVWSLYHDVTSGITTTNVITGGSSGGDQNILLVGVDSRTDAQGNPLPPEVLAQLRSGADSGVLNSDTIILVHVPADGGSATAFSIPRDSYVNIPGYRQDKINAAYPATKAEAASKLVADGVKDPKQIDQQSSATGRSALIRTVQDLTGLSVDHYAEVNLLGFYNLTNAIGGVDVCLKAPANDPLSGADFAAGPQTIAGADALAFVRQRHGLAGGDLSRIKRQQVFMAAVANKILSGGTLTDSDKLSALVGVVQQSVVIDSGWDVLSFARQASDIAAGKMDFLTIPTGGTEDNARGDVLAIDENEVRDFVARQTEPEPEPEPADAPAPAPVTADVGNGSGTTGLAAQVAGTLSQNGITPGTVGNAPDRVTSVVRYAGADGDAAARQVAGALGGIGVEQSDGVAPGRVQVLIGTDFDDGGAGATAASSSGPSGSAGASAASAPAAAPVAPPITAGGVPCID